MRLAHPIFPALALAMGCLLSNFYCSVQAQIPYGTFEVWSDSTVLYSNPENWSSLNEIHYLLGYEEFTVTKTDVSSEGSFGLQLETKKFCNADSSLCNLVPGMAVLGDLYVNPADLSIITPGLPYTERPNSLTAQYKYYPVDADTFLVVAELSRSVGGSKEVVAYGEFRSGLYMPQFNALNLQLTYYSDSTPDKIRIAVFSSLNQQAYFDDYPVGSRLIIDNVNLSEEMVSTGFNPVADAVDRVVLYPVPANDRFTAEWTPLQSGSYLLQLVDITGRTLFVNRQLVSQGVREQSVIPCQDIPAGTYWLNIRSENGGASASRMVTILH